MPQDLIDWGLGTMLGQVGVGDSFSSSVPLGGVETGERGCGFRTGLTRDKNPCLFKDGRMSTGVGWRNYAPQLCHAPLCVTVCSDVGTMARVSRSDGGN